MISLVMLSGGIDSAYALHKILVESQDEVLVHHIHLVTDQGRHIPEAASCKKIVEYCRKNVRPFFYSESTIDHRRFVAPGYDLLAAGFEAAVVASSYAVMHREQKFVDRWIIGLSSDDEVPERRIERADKVARFNCMTLKPPALFIFPLVDVNEQIRNMPHELLDMTWSCRTPRGLPDKPEPCGGCRSCVRRTKALAEIKIGRNDWTNGAMSGPFVPNAIAGTNNQVKESRNGA